MSMAGVHAAISAGLTPPASVCRCARCDPGGCGDPFPSLVAVDSGIIAGTVSHNLHLDVSLAKVRL